MTLYELLNLSKLKSVQLVAGEKGKDVTVSGAVMLDNPEMVDWMRTGELLLTTGYVLKENPQKQEEILRSLIQNKASGLAIKTRRYFEEIPPNSKGQIAGTLKARTSSSMLLSSNYRR